MLSQGLGSAPNTASRFAAPWRPGCITSLRGEAPGEDEHTRWWQDGESVMLEQEQVCKLSLAGEAAAAAERLAEQRRGDSATDGMFGGAVDKEREDPDGRHQGGGGAGEEEDDGDCDVDVELGGGEAHELAVGLTLKRRINASAGEEWGGRAGGLGACAAKGDCALLRASFVDGRSWLRRAAGAVLGRDAAVLEARSALAVVQTEVEAPGAASSAWRRPLELPLSGRDAVTPLPPPLSTP
jgi:hypothetical protein